MARNIELLLLENVENLGIVGDIVKVRPGYARNYLLPHAMAEFPTPKKIEALKEARAKAQAELAHLRSVREELIERMKAVRIVLKRSCNDQGVLYGSVTQRDIADGLVEAGYGVDVRAIRLNQSIRRVGEYHVPVQFERDLRTEVTVAIEPDRSLAEEKQEMDFDNEGNLITPERKARREARRREKRGEFDAPEEANVPAATNGAAEAPARPAKPAKAEKSADEAPEMPKAARKAKPAKA